MSALILAVRNELGTKPVKFVFEDGHLPEALELLASYLIELGEGPSLWENVAADRLGIILRQQAEIRELRQWALLAGYCPPASEAAG